MASVVTNFTRSGILILSESPAFRSSLRSLLGDLGFGPVFSYAQVERGVRRLSSLRLAIALVDMEVAGAGDIISTLAEKDIPHVAVSRKAPAVGGYWIASPVRRAQLEAVLRNILSAAGPRSATALPPRGDTLRPTGSA